MTAFFNIKYTGTTNPNHFMYNGVNLWTAAPGDQITIPSYDLWYYLPPNNDGPVALVAWSPDGSTWHDIVNNVGYNGSMQPLIASTGVRDFASETWGYEVDSPMYELMKMLGSTAFTGGIASNLNGLLNQLQQQNMLHQGFAPLQQPPHL